MTKDKALKMAIKAEETGNLLDLVDDLGACKEALEQPAQEPVYFVQHPNGYGWIDVDKDKYNQEKYDEDKWKLYTHPHHWQRLTKYEIIQADNESNDLHAFARAIEAKLKKKNT
jgi:hypothetical protein